MTVSSDCTIRTFVAPCFLASSAKLWTVVFSVASPTSGLVMNRWIAIVPRVDVRQLVAIHSFDAAQITGGVRYCTAGRNAHD
jgi:hypothetical protein